MIKTISANFNVGTAILNVEQDVLIKVCGMTNKDEVKEALTYGVNLIGLIFAKSPRSVNPDVAKEIVDVVRRYGEREERVTFREEISAVKKDLALGNGESIVKDWYGKMANHIKDITNRKPLTVGVFQDHTVEEINEIIEKTGIDIVQLHGNERPEVIERLNAPCIKVLHISATEEKGGSSSDEFTLAEARSFASKAIALLLDTKVGASTESGGTGVTFDWDLVERIDMPVILAGGLHEDNVVEALKVKGIVGVDASSSLEVRAGRKDMKKVRNYASNIRKKKI